MINIIKYKLSIIFFILFFVSSAYSLEYNLLTLYQIHADWGSQEAFTLQRIMSDTNGRIYMVYNANSGNNVAVKYSDDDGVNWTQNDPNDMIAKNNPSLWIKPSSSILSIAAVTSSDQMGPYYEEKDGSWGSPVAIEDASPLPCNNDVAQILWENGGGNPWCVYRYASDGSTFDYIECAQKSAGSWSNGTQLSTPVPSNSLSACMGDVANDNEAWVAWRAKDPNTYYIKTAYYDGNSWSAISTIDAIDDADDMGLPVIRNLGGIPTIMYYTQGKGVNDSYYQGMYSVYVDANSSWNTTASITDVARNNKFFIPFINGDDETCALYASYGIDSNNPNFYNMAYTCLSGGSWTDPIILTAEAKTVDAYSVYEEGNTLHILIRDTANTKQYYAGLDISATAITNVQIIKNIL